MTLPKVLVVDDKENMRKLLAKVFGEAYAVETVGDGALAMQRIAEERFDVVVTDLRMPGADGMQVLAAVQRFAPTTEVVMMTAYATVGDAVAAIKLGAYDYLQKPFDPDAAVLTVGRAIERKRLKEQASALRRELVQRHSFHALVAKSAPMGAVFRLLSQASELDISVLLLGETGTGKELAARAIHYQSARSEHPFVPVNCGALPAELVESELFGHVRGAFTGATSDKAGLFSEASGGTIFLDEIGELPLPMQVKLNRALQEREIRRVGGTTATTIDVRVIAATQRDLKGEVENDRFRNDLYYRLNVFPIRMPPLRQRPEDIPLLAEHFLQKHALAFHRDVTSIGPEVLRALIAHPWPGNVRELEHAIERAVAVASGAQIEWADLPASVIDPNEASAGVLDVSNLPYREAVEAAKNRFAEEYLTALLRDCEGNVTRAANRAGIERESLHRLLKRAGIQSDTYKPEGA